MPSNVHNWLIKKAAKEILAPLGVFQVGQSRVWIDDRNWYLIQVEFQPSAWSKGAYLNVGISFLWEKSGDLAEEFLSFDVGYRENSHIEFSGKEDLFYEQMLKLACLAKEKILYYRKFDDLEFCRNELEKEAIKKDSLWHNWNMAMFCFFIEETVTGKHYLERAVKDCEESNINWVQQLRRKCKKLLTEEVDLTQFVTNSINDKKNFFQQKNSYKKLKNFDLVSVKN